MPSFITQQGFEANMGTDNEKFAGLVTQVAELLNILLETSAADDIGEVESIVQELGRYIQQLENIATAAEAIGYIGLCNVCMLYQESLVQLACHSEALSEGQRLLLEAWPTLVMAHLEAPADADISVDLVEHLQNPAWAAPLSDIDAELLKELLIGQATAASEPDGAVDVAPAAPSLVAHDTEPDVMAYEEERDDVTRTWQSIDADPSQVDPACEVGEHSETLEDSATFAALDTLERSPMAFEGTREDAVQAEAEYEAISGNIDATGAEDLEETASGSIEETAVGELDETAKELVGLLCQ